MSTRRQSIERRIQTIKRQIAALGDLRPGKLSEQYNVCGKADCRCKVSPPVKHGPYYQISFTLRNKSRTQFVRREDLPVVKRQLLGYQRLRDLIDRWIELGMELSRLKLEQGHSPRSAPRARPVRPPTKTTRKPG
jgi:hypothetical protein